MAHDQAKGLMVELRQIVHGIRPQSLTDLGLAGAVRELAGAATVPVTVHADLEAAAARTRRDHRVLRGRPRRWATSPGTPGRPGPRSGSPGPTANSSWRSTDDGHGGADPARGTGLTGLADRVAAADGRLLLSSPPGGPTLVRVELPCRR